MNAMTIRAVHAEKMGALSKMWEGRANASKAFADRSGILRKSLIVEPRMQ